MSLYNAIFGRNAHTELILSLLELRESDIERFRDCSIDYENKHIIILARTGGGNREDYPNEKLVSHPCYVRDHDDEFDCTYATYYFNFPEDLTEDIIKLNDIEQYGIPSSIIKLYNKVILRTPTSMDVYKKEYNYQRDQIDGSMRNGNIRCFNGWIYVPLNNYGMVRLLAVMEAANGKFHLGMVSFHKLKVEHHTTFDKDEDRIKISTTDEIDTDYLKYIINTYGKRYPLAIKFIQEGI